MKHETNDWEMHSATPSRQDGTTSIQERFRAECTGTVRSCSMHPTGWEERMRSPASGLCKALSA
ncbi:MAG TPA: hypothetical protein VNQ76_21250 [Planctomicrobium sp.]|nr:hypothetical protein [Planctomicrobium sp.]